MNRRSMERRLNFSMETMQIETSRLRYCVPPDAARLNSPAYGEVLRSIAKAGAMKALVVIPCAEGAGGLSNFLVADGHLRLAALRAQRVERVRCVVPSGSKARHRAERLNLPSLVHEQQIVSRALQAGVAVHALAEMFDVPTSAITFRQKVLRYICAEVIELLAETSTSEGAFDCLRRMLPERQIEVAQSMIRLGDFSARLAFALLKASPPERLRRRLRLSEWEWTEADRASAAEADSQFEEVATRTQSQYESHSNAALELVILQGHVRSLLGNARLVGWLARCRPVDLHRLQSIVEGSA